MSVKQKETLTLVRKHPISRKRTGGMTFEKETFSPAQAEKTLEVSRACGFINRNPSAPAINKLAHEMKNGRFFADTGETLKFSEKDGQEVLIDGQHRLEAVIRAKRSQSFWVTRGVPLKAFRYLDQGKAREVKDILFIEDERWRDNTVALAVAGRMLWKRAITGDPTKKPKSDLNESEGNIADAIRENWPDLPDVFAEYKDRLNAAQHNRCGAKSLFLYLLYEWRKVDVTLTQKVADYIGDRYETPAPARYFAWAMQYVDGVRNEAARNAGKITKGRHKDVVDETVRAWMIAWNMTRSGNNYQKCTFDKRLRETVGIPLAQ
ncbi:MAG: hypothetical protein QNI96_05190 [Woeseiaceae bacterium]|nr:hypothetical protein [Woeseiaceae bacterium]